LDEDSTSLELSSELIEETLKYFVLSGERISQMTKTYNDIDAVTRLLEEVSLLSIPFPFPSLSLFIALLIIKDVARNVFDYNH